MMKPATLYFMGLLLLFSCSEAQKAEKSPKFQPEKPELTQIDEYIFRRAYFGHEDLEGEELETFMNRNPEAGFEAKDAGAFYKYLVQAKVITDQTLNYKMLEELPDTFEYHFSKNRILKVDIEFIDWTKQHPKHEFVLTFHEKNKIVAINTLEFDFPPDVTFSKMDANGDGKDEIYALYQQYIINGDNFHLKIYELK